MQRIDCEIITVNALDYLLNPFCFSGFSKAAQKAKKKVELMHQKPVMTLLRMKSLEGKLPESKFMRVHRSFIVNTDKIRLNTS